VTLSWWPWYRDVLDGLGVRLAAADVDWATDGEGNPWLIEGQQRPAGIGHPHAMVLQFSKRRDAAESRRGHELARLDTTVAVFEDGDVHRAEVTLRRTVKHMAAVETAIYADRSLGGNADYVVIDSADAFEMETTIGSELVGSIELTVTKTADL
jgi:hypothetical protein